jgi:hypothetical protein
MLPCARPCADHPTVRTDVSFGIEQIRLTVVHVRQCCDFTFHGSVKRFLAYALRFPVSASCCIIDRRVRR